MRFLYAVSITSTIFSLSLACKGCVNLDEHSFDKIIPRFEVVLVKFDVAYPYGQKHDVFASVASEVKDNRDILFAEVGVKDYGEKDGEQLAKRFGIRSKDDLPALKLFVQGEDEPFAFESKGVWKEETIKKFIRDHTNVYLGLPGCLKQFDKLAMKFSSSDDQAGILEEAETAAKQLKSENEKKMADKYIKFMMKIIEKGEKFVLEEKRRLGKILKEGKVNETKKEELSHRLNILSSFSAIKTEL